MKKFLIYCASIALLVLVGGQANAMTVSYTSTFAVSNNTNFATATDSIDVTPFDPSLGTLNSVSVSISGQTHVDYTAMPFFTGQYPAGYTYNIFADQSFIGAGNKYFAFGSPATFGWMLAWYDALGNASHETFDNTFTYDFTFNDVTDQAGQAALTTTNTTGFNSSSPSTVNGYLANFIDDGLSVNQILLLQFPKIITQVTSVPFTMATTGLLTLTYDYADAPLDPAPVPEPSTMLLFGSGLFSLAGFRKRFFKNQ